MSEDQRKQLAVMRYCNEHMNGRILDEWFKLAWHRP